MCLLCWSRQTGVRGAGGQVLAARGRLWVYRFGGEGEDRWVRHPPDKREELFGETVWSVEEE